MPFWTDLKKDFVLLSHQGEVTLQEAAAARIEMLRLVRLNNLSKVVIDVRNVTGEADPSDLRTLMEENAKVEPPRPHAAIVVRDDQYAQFKFIEDFAVSRGMPIRVFTNEREAFDWLVD